MPSPKQEGCSYVTGAVRYTDLVYFGLVTDEMASHKLDHSLFVEWDGGVWRGSNLAPVKWTTVGATVVNVPSQQALFLGYWGEVLCLGSGDVHEEKIQSALGSPAERGPMRGIRSIDGKAYAVGMYRQVYRRDSSNVWTCIDQAVRPQAQEGRVVSFETIDGFSAQEIYAAGRQGEIWGSDGRDWNKFDSPTNLILTNICCAGNETAYICGQRGTLVRGRYDRWEIIEQSVTEEDFWGIAWYDGKLYLSTMRFVYTLEDGNLKQVEFGGDVPETCFHLSAADGVLWSIGAKDVFSYDGSKWTRVD